MEVQSYTLTSKNAWLDLHKPKAEISSFFICMVVHTLPLIRCFIDQVEKIQTLWICGGAWFNAYTLQFCSTEPLIMVPRIAESPYGGITIVTTHEKW